jgi:predicted naringenin-chalcone synthase
MRPALRRTSILGMGCYAAFPGLLRASEAVIARPGSTALVLAVELCSLHFQMDESLENIVSTALFADGAAAALVTSRAPVSYPRPVPHIVDALTFCDYTTFDHMAFHLTNFGFQMRLSAYVPELLAAKIENFVDTLLGRNRLSRESVRWWGIHPGSSKILDHVQERLGLSDAQLAPSRTVLRDYGNMSSPTILFVLDVLQREQPPARGDYGVLMAFGPGLTMESLLVQW